MLYLSIKIHQIQAVETRDTFIILQLSAFSYQLSAKTMTYQNRVNNDRFTLLIQPIAFIYQADR
jgi:hypothetical protein